MKEFLLLCLLPLSTLGALLGGFKPVEFDDPAVLSHLRPVLESKPPLKNWPVRRVEQQKLFGVTKYRIILSIPERNGVEVCLRTTCRNNGKCKELALCGQHGKPEPTIKTPSHTDRSKPAMKSHRLLGGEEAGSEKDVQGAVQFAVEKLNAMSNSMYRAVAEKITNITKQVVAGMKYKFTISLVYTECRNAAANRGKQLDVCRLSNDARGQQCRVTVWRQVSGDYSLLDHQCGETRPQHHLLGGDGHDRCHIYLDDFRKFKQDFNRLYSSHKEEEQRFQIFCTNMKRIKTLQENKGDSAVYGVTKFADISEEEFRKHYLTPKWDVTTPQKWMVPAAPANPQNDPIPKRFDWRDHDAVTPVKNQGGCGSCWAFSTTGNIEGQVAIKKKTLLSLSEQELVDCDKLDQGCEGGLPANAYQAIKTLGGLETEKDYSYKGKDEKCEFNRTEVAIKVSGGLNISSNEEEMKAWLSKNGPISIGINAFAMQFYFGGISHPWKIFCNPDSLDHGVLIVGYDVSSKGEPYWIVKNSWGADWGEKGYYLVYRGSGVCGLNRMCTSAIIN
ncbi:hypothetical protein ACOMHN_050883 [Nucella lapillus]